MKKTKEQTREEIISLWLRDYTKKDIEDIGIYTSEEIDEAIQHATQH